uniref:Uncharacterized protein n=1 Tax=Nelumbo nucifera TaxID=4432 RepID=A0A822ZRW1_NELNU|nr:TPA_asm: hypothetical protein HUJ06_004319 [Nelumbo nucifera]
MLDEEIKRVVTHNYEVISTCICEIGLRFLNPQRA